MKKRTQRKIKRIAWIGIVSAMIAGVWIWLRSRLKTPTATASKKAVTASVPEAATINYSYTPSPYVPPKTEFKEDEFSDEFK